MAVAASETEGEEPPHWPQFINFGEFRTISSINYFKKNEIS